MPNDVLSFNTWFPVLQAEHIYNLALKSSDELFHVKLYEWMVSKDLTDKLMQVCYIVVITTLLSSQLHLSQTYQQQVTPC